MQGGGRRGGWRNLPQRRMRSRAVQPGRNRPDSLIAISSSCAAGIGTDETAEPLRDLLRLPGRGTQQRRSGDGEQVVRCVVAELDSPHSSRLGGGSQGRAGVGGRLGPGEGCTAVGGRHQAVPVPVEPGPAGGQQQHGCPVAGDRCGIGGGTSLGLLGCGDEGVGDFGGDSVAEAYCPPCCTGQSPLLVLPVEGEFFLWTDQDQSGWRFDGPVPAMLGGEVEGEVEAVSEAGRADEDVGSERCGREQEAGSSIRFGPGACRRRARRRGWPAGTPPRWHREGCGRWRPRRGWAGLR